MFCEICGRPRSFLASFFGGRAHPACIEAQEKRQREEAEAQRKRQREEEAALHKTILEQIEKGVFRGLNEHSEVMLDEGEILCMLIKGCWSTFFYPRAAGRIKPGQVVRVDGLKKVDFGSLHVTDKRICFIGKGGAKTIPLKKLLQCQVGTDTLHVTAEGRSSSTYFIIESPAALELARASILKLTELAKTGNKPVIR
ncbi:MAG: hypothetical protein ABSF14_01195 [Terriglobia bacterium]